MAEEIKFYAERIRECQENVEYQAKLCASFSNDYCLRKALLELETWQEMAREKGIYIV